jgi:hypothetical protein
MTDSTKPILSHFDESGNAAMVDVSAKQSTRRTATASAFVEFYQQRYWLRCLRIPKAIRWKSRGLRGFRRQSAHPS